MTAWLEAEDWPIAGLDVESLRLLGSPVDPAAPTSLMDRDNDGHLERMVKFSRSAFAALPAGENVLCLTGHTASGTPVTGCGVLHVEGSGTKAKKPGAARPHGLAIGVRGGIIVFEVGEPVEATLEVLDVQGRIVERLFSGVAASGEQAIAWPGPGRAVPAGIYFARLRSRYGQEVARLAVTR